MIVKSLLERLADALPVNNFVTVHDVLRAVEGIFGRNITTEHNILMRRHINLLSALRAAGVLAIGNVRDEWNVEVPAVKETTRYIDVTTIDGVMRYERQELPLRMSEEQISDAVGAMNGVGIDEPYFAYASGGKFNICGTVDMAQLSELLQLARAAQP